jgi:hypothetical protein
VLRLIVGADGRIGEPTTSIETDGVGFFPVDDLPELRVMECRVRRLYELAQDPTLAVDFD